MRILSLLMSIMIVVSFAGAIYGKEPFIADESMKNEAKHGLEQILDLWRDGKYAELYDRTYGGSDSRERFEERLASAPRKPACCWEKMQDLKVSPKSVDKVSIWARIGLEGTGNSESVTRSFKLIKEDGVWKVSRKDILTLSAASKKKNRYMRR